MNNNFVVIVVVLILLTITVAPINGDWVDPDTPQASRQTKALTKGDHREFKLVFSDEFEQDGRTFHDGHDPRWTAINKNDYTNAALHYYSHDNARTKNGLLHITTEQKVNAYKAFDEDKKTFYKDYKHVQTAMLQGWNKFCFIGGIVEFSAKLPGDPTIGGLWPALWMLGNLARATYVGSSDFMWPFSYNQCNESFRNGQEINSCSRMNHYDLPMYRGRGAPEIDVIEAMQGAPGKLPSTTVQRPYQSASFQVAPGVSVDRPSLGKRPDPNNWYTHLEYGNKTKADLNPFFYGVTLFHKPKSYTYQADALSANMPLNKTHYERQHIYRVEWEPASLQNGTGGYIKWFSDNELVYGIYADSLSLMGTEIPTEPMYLLMNTAVSSDWGFPKPCPEGCDCECYHCGNIECRCGQPKDYCNNFPASFDIDYVRVYQAVDDENHILGCSPKDRPTATFIQGHKKRYMDMDASGVLPNNHQPLQPIQRGGGICVDDSDCGRKGLGTCYSANVCTCADIATGPHCLSHAGFYDYDTSAPPQPFYWYRMVFPRSLCVFMAILALSFILSMATAVRERWREPGYTKIPASFGPPAVAMGEFASASVASFSYPAVPMTGSMNNGNFSSGSSINNSMALGAPNRDGLGVGSYIPNYSVIANDYNNVNININAYNNMAHQRPSSVSYHHNAASPHYALPTAATTQNEMTYCVIDGRLVDN